MNITADNTTIVPLLPFLNRIVLLTETRPYAEDTLEIMGELTNVSKNVEFLEGTLILTFRDGVTYTVRPGETVKLELPELP